MFGYFSHNPFHAIGQVSVQRRILLVTHLLILVVPLGDAEADDTPKEPLGAFLNGEATAAVALACGNSYHKSDLLNMSYINHNCMLQSMENKYKLTLFTATFTTGAKVDARFEIFAKELLLAQIALLVTAYGNFADL